jgi:hypothetical protein
MKGWFTVKKLLALMIVGGLVALIAGCPPATTTGTGPKSGSPTTKAGDTAKTDKDTAKTDKDTAKTDKDTAKTDKDKEPAVKTHKGTVVKVDGTMLTMKGDDGKEMKHDLKDAKITRDGKDIKADELKADDKITVTMEGDKVTKVEAAK